jgi:hypothetical protein
MKGAYTYEKKLTNATTRHKAKPTILTEEPLELDAVEVKQVEQRLLISLFYVQTMKAPPPVEWQGEDGTVSEIVRALKLTKNQRKRVLPVITDTRKALLEGDKYDPTRMEQAGSRKIEDGSQEQQMMLTCVSLGVAIQRDNLGGQQMVLGKQSTHCHSVCYLDVWTAHEKVSN